MSEQSRYEVVVVGGGQAGLALGYYLTRQGRRFTILDAAAEPAAAWRERWDSLRLFTPVRYDSLPGLTFPGDPDSYPSRDEVAEYLTEYVQKFHLPVELNSRVRSVSNAGDGYLVELEDRSLQTEQVVIATGPFQDPIVPALSEGLDADVVQMHSTAYRSPRHLPAGRVLVVGGGNTGFQIAAELAGSHDVHLAVSSRQTPLPQRIFGRDLFRYLEATGLMAKTVDSRIGQRMQYRETLIGSSPRALRRKYGVQLHPRATEASSRKVSFEDGTSLDVGSVIWATGFRLDYSWIDVPVFDDDHRPVQQRGVTESPGLYFLGLPWQHTRGSALLGWIKHDAEHLAQQVAAFSQAQPPPAPAVLSTAPPLTGERDE